jgi:hypothetical protein
VEDDQSAPVVGATVALVPSDATRKKGMSKPILSSAGGHFHFGAVAPGAYKIFAFEDADPNRLMYDPDFLRPFESRGESVEVSEGGKASVKVQLIRATTIAGLRPARSQECDRGSQEWLRHVSSTKYSRLDGLVGS